MFWNNFIIHVITKKELLLEKMFLGGGDKIFLKYEIFL